MSLAISIELLNNAKSKSLKECLEMEERYSLLRKESGNIAMPGFTAPKILWIKKYEKEIFKQIYKVLLPKDYLRYRLSNNFYTDMSDASGTLGLPAGLESPDQDDIVALGNYKNFLVVFMTNNVQLWQTDTDPVNIKLHSVVENSYTAYPNSIAKLGPDVIFLNEDGFSSLSQML